MLKIKNLLSHQKVQQRIRTKNKSHFRKIKFKISKTLLINGFKIKSPRLISKTKKQIKGYFQKIKTKNNNYQA